MFKSLLPALLVVLTVASNISSTEAKTKTKIKHHVIVPTATQNKSNHQKQFKADKVYDTNVNTPTSVVLPNTTPTVLPAGKSGVKYSKPSYIKSNINYSNPNFIKSSDSLSLRLPPEDL